MHTVWCTLLMEHLFVSAAPAQARVLLLSKLFAHAFRVWSMYCCGRAVAAVQVDQVSYTVFYHTNLNIAHIVIYMSA